MNKKKILFIGYDASKTGAPILLLDIASSLSREFNTDFLFHGGGVLYDDYKKLGQVHNLKKNKRTTTLLKRIINKFKRLMFGSDREQIFRKIEKVDYDIIYLNTVAVLPLFLEIKSYLKGKVVCHIHEMEMAINIFCRKNEIELADKFIAQYIAVSNAVKMNLISNHGVDEDKIEVVYGYSSMNNKQIFKSDLLKVLKIKQGSYIIGNVGRADLIKGFDVFINIAKNLSKIEKNIIFVWVGHIPEENRGVIKESISRLKLNDKVIFTGSKDTSAIYPIFDIFIHTSREDSFPLSVLEAAQNGLPIISFEGSGGSKEFIEKTKAGKLVPYLDSSKMVNEILELKRDNSSYKKLKDYALSAKAIFNREISVTQISEILYRLN